MNATEVQAPAQVDELAHVRQLHANVRDVLDLLQQLRARWVGYSVWRIGQPEICVRLSHAGDLPSWLDAQRVPLQRVDSDDQGPRWHARVRDALVTWPVEAPR